MDTAKIFWNRIGYVAIEDRSGKMIKYGGDIDGLDFKFTGTMNSDIYTEFEVGILGLSAEKIGEITVWNPEESTGRRRKIQVFAGYEKDGLANPLFEGFIYEALPTNPPEMWLNMKCLVDGNKIIPVDEHKVITGTPEEIFKQIGNELGKSTRWQVTKIDNKTKIKFDFTGSKLSLVRSFADALHITVTDISDVLVADNFRPWLNEVKDPILIDVEHGMIGLGAISIKGATIRSRLNGSIPIAGWVRLKSVIIPKANGDYFVIKKKHVGHFRGDDWYTEVECVRKAMK